MRNEYKGMKVLVVGMGRSGIAAAYALHELGADVSCQDSAAEEKIDPGFVSFAKSEGLKTWFGKSPTDPAFDQIVVSPGVPLKLDFLKEARAKGIEIIGELEAAYRIGKGSYVAITGTNGKTTTTTLVGEIFRAAGLEAFTVGNIGTAVISKAMDASEDSWMITETSSFQLETIKQFRPKVSAILNLTPDHLDRHGSFENYIAAKARVFENQGEGDYAVLNDDDPETKKLMAKVPCTVVPFSRLERLNFGAFVENGSIVVRDDSGKTVYCRCDELKIPGEHNLENALAAAAICHFAGVPREAISETLKSFAGVEHRIEKVKEIGGVTYVNDSKGTNPDAAIRAIKAVKGDVILIAGGYDKGSEYEEFVEAFGGKVKHVLLIGATAPKIKETCEKSGFRNITMLGTISECVEEAARIALPGDTVLLSPACASWDMYDNFEQRGDDFKACVERLGR